MSGIYAGTARLIAQKAAASGGGGGGGGGGSSFPTIGNAVFVSKSGNDATGARESLGRTFFTMGAALAAALDGDTIFVYPGVYTESLITISKRLTIDLQGATIVSRIVFSSAFIEILNGNITAPSTLIDGIKMQYAPSGAVYKLKNLVIDGSIIFGAFTPTIDFVNCNISHATQVPINADSALSQLTIRIKDCTIDSPANTIAAFGRSNWQIYGCIMNNSTSILPAITFIIFTATQRGRICNTKLYASLTSSTFSPASASGTFIEISNCQSNRAWPIGSGWIVNNAFTDTQLIPIP